MHSKTDRVALNWLIASTSAAASDALNAGSERPNFFFSRLHLVFIASSPRCRCLSLPLMFCRIVLSATVAVRDKRRCTIGCHTRPPPSLPQSANLFSLRWSSGLEISRTFSPPGCVGLCVCVCFICSQFNLISCSYAKYLDVLFHSNPFSSAGRHSLVKNGPANSLKSKSRPFRFTSNQAIFNVHRPV